MPVQIPIKLLKEWFYYEPNTGNIRYRIKRFKAEKDSIAGFIATNGYRIIKIAHQGKRITSMAHRLAWALYYGKYPDHDIDHINRVKNDNRIENLRELSASLNLARRKTKERGLPRGVTWAGHTNKTNPYYAQLTSNSKTVFRGYFSTAELAHKAYRGAFLKEFGKHYEDL